MMIDLSDDPALAADIAALAAFCGQSADEVAKRALLAGLREMGRRSRLSIGPPLVGTGRPAPEDAVTIRAGELVVSLPGDTRPDRIAAVARELDQAELL